MPDDAVLLARIDLMVVLAANLFNLLMVGIFLSRPAGLKRLESALGLVGVALVLPLAIAIAVNLRLAREWWAWFLPGLLALFLLVELLLDYVLKLPFRKTRLIGPYLLLYYLALMGMIGYAFLVSKPFGFATLGTYFINLLATWYSYSRVGY